MNDLTEGLAIENFDSISSSEKRGQLLKLVEQAFSRLAPESLLKDCMRGILGKGAEYSNVYVIGFGKASLKMYGGIRNEISGAAKYCGIIVPDGEDGASEYPELEVLKGNHPIPALGSLESSRRILAPLKGLQEDDLVIVLISGGGSALFEIPEKGFTIDEIGNTAKCLMESGADIHELNAVRHVMSSVKGGKLARMLFPAEVHSFIISDVPGDDPAVIASGPLAKPSSDRAYMSGVVEKYSGKCKVLKRKEFLGPAEPVEPKVFKHVTNKMILKNMDFVNLISSMLAGSGDDIATIPEPVTGDVRKTAQWFAEKMRKQYRISGKPVWIVGGGETTAEVHGNGSGGRNCELSLRVALNMEEGEDFMFASLGSDGIDGSSPAMGGITDTQLMGKTSRDEIEASLSGSDSYTLLKKYDSAVMTGYTGTNVSDIFISYYAGKSRDQ